MMEKDNLNKIVAQKKSNCEQGLTIVDIDNSMAKGYTTAGRIQRNKAANGLCSGANLFNELGIDYCGN